MEIRTIKPINFLFFRTQTTVDQLINMLPIAQELYEEAVKINLRITGPIHWHYLGFTGDESKPFQLEICLPVAEGLDGYDGKFHFKRTDSFKSVSLFHEGDWHEIPKSYRLAFDFIGKQNLKPNGMNREVYINTDFKNPEANFTEIQIGID